MTFARCSFPHSPAIEREREGSADMGRSIERAGGMSVIHHHSGLGGNHVIRGA